MSLLALPTLVCDCILDHFNKQNNHKVINLDDATRRLMSLGPHSVSRKWKIRYAFLMLCGAHTSYLFNVGSTTRVSNFPGIRCLHKLLHTKFAWQPEWNSPVDDRYFGERCSATICINFTLNQAGTLRDVRFDITLLIEATMMTEVDWNVVVSIRCSGGSDGDLGCSHTTTLSQICRDALKVWPPVSVLYRPKNPEIWVNGLFKMVEVVGYTELIGLGWHPFNLGDITVSESGGDLV